MTRGSTDAIALSLRLPWSMYEKLQHKETLCSKVSLTLQGVCANLQLFKEFNLLVQFRMHR
ncbi:hypothetical protein NC651_011000 [Populus alba x Populus x berolinensis]|nr:hypothetical protein NC651_011000 [Populus alba x Populus x berolinensis]